MSLPGTDCACVWQFRFTGLMECTCHAVHCLRRHSGCSVNQVSLIAAQTLPTFALSRLPHYPSNTLFEPSACPILCVMPAAPGISASPSEENLRYFNVMILGPSQSPYEGGVFKLELFLPEDYPMAPPKVGVCVPVPISTYLYPARESIMVCQWLGDGLSGCCTCPSPLIKPDHRCEIMHCIDWPM